MSEDAREDVYTETKNLLWNELAFARRKFPSNEDKLAALTEEVGELAQALLHHKHEGGSAASVLKEAIQVASTAIRIAEEGSAEFPYAFKDAYAELVGDAPND